MINKKKNAHCKWTSGSNGNTYERAQEEYSV